LPETVKGELPTTSESFGWKKIYGKTSHHPVLCVCLSPSFIEENPYHHRWIWSQIFQHGLKVASEEIQKNVWPAFDTRKIGEYVHIKKVTWQRMKQCFTGAGICGIGAFSSF